MLDLKVLAIAIYRIAGIFRRCKFSYELPSLIFRTINVRTGLNAYVLPLVLPIAYIAHLKFRSFNFRMMLFNTKYTKISTI